MPYTIDTANRSDAPDVMALIGRIFDEYGFDWTAEEEFWDLLGPDYPYDPPRGQMWVMRDQMGQVVGSVAVEQLDERTAEFHRLYLDARLRGTGRGRRLLETAERWAIAQGCVRGILWSDTNFLDAHRLYERMGYERSGQRQLDDRNQTVEYGFERRLGEPPSGSV